MRLLQNDIQYNIGHGYTHDTHLVFYIIFYNKCEKREYIIILYNIIFPNGQ